MINNKHYLKFYHTNKHFYVQIILGDDIVVSSSTLNNNLKNKIKSEKLSGTAIISVVIDDLITKLKEKKINILQIHNIKYKYHGKTKYFLDQLRTNSIHFL